MYLLDTNIWLERLLGQTRADEVGQFLDEVPADQLFITDFSFHSIGVILSRLGQRDTLIQFTQDIFIDGAVTLLHLRPQDTQQVVEAMTRFNLDFDDAYQYAAAAIHELILISFDGDFDRTELGRRTPIDVLQDRA